uniref:Secreted protein n=1 Tax=Cacopsylla melanoneura TaxID=428564 RepID=A0A8D8TIL1_9HEMI
MFSTLRAMVILSFDIICPAAKMIHHHKTCLQLKSSIRGEQKTNAAFTQTVSQFVQLVSTSYSTTESLVVVFYFTNATQQLHRHIISSLVLLFNAPPSDTAAPHSPGG